MAGAGFAAGVIATSLRLGALLIGLSAIGMEIGWSFQLQSPGVILVLLVLTGAIALNLAGLFELQMPPFAARGSQTGGFLGAFSTRAPAAFIAFDRKCVVQGTSVSLRVDLGGRGVHKKKKTR